jgi:WD40 repeat protein
MTMGTFSAGRLAFSPDGRVLAAGDYRGNLILFDVARRSRLAILPTGIGGINDLAFRADGRSVVVGGDGPGDSGRGAAVVDVARRRPLAVLQIPGSSGSEVTVAFRPDGTALAATGGSHNGVTLWNVKRRGHLLRMFMPQQVTGVVLSRGAGLLAMASPGGEVTLWDFGRHVQLGSLPSFRPRPAFSLSPRTGTFTNDGKRLAISDGTGSVFVWRTSNR